MEGMNGTYQINLSIPSTQLISVGTVFAYGQTASGKTYTMTGIEGQPGIIPQAIEDVFAYIHEVIDCLPLSHPLELMTHEVLVDIRNSRVLVTSVLHGDIQRNNTRSSDS